jgi:tetratricopeptide (TPR) repeat protein
MNRRRTVGWTLACLAVILIASVFIEARKRRRPPLPDLVSYPNLPVQFNRALTDAREAALAHGYKDEDVREVAHLYQANRLFAQARKTYGVIAAGSIGLGTRDHYYLAAIDLDESDLEGAQAELRAALQAEPGYIPARLELADALFKGGKPEEAGKEYASILGTEANHPQAAFGMARVELQRGNEDAAVARLKELIIHHPDSTYGAALLAQILDRRGDADGAASMRELSRQNHEPVPPDPWARALLEDCYDLQRLGITFEEYRLDGQMDEALPLLGRLEELDPNGWIPPMLHGWSEKEAGHYPEAVRQYRLALSRGGDPERICPLLVAALLTEGSAKEAAALLADYHSRLPHSLPILRSYCEVAVRMKDDALARTLLAEALKEDPYLYMANMSLFQILWNAGEHDAASACLQRVAKVFPSDVDSRGLLGQYFMEKSDPWSAIPPLEQAVGIVPAADARRNRLTQMLDTAYLAAGSLEASRGQFPKALDFSEKSIRLAPSGLRGYALKANVCRRTRDLKGAEQALAKMVALQPDEPTIQLSLGDVLYQDGERDRARECWQRALQDAPAAASELRRAISLRLSGNITAETLR